MLAQSETLPPEINSARPTQVGMVSADWVRILPLTGHHPTQGLSRPVLPTPEGGACGVFGGVSRLRKITKGSDAGFTAASGGGSGRPTAQPIAAAAACAGGVGYGLRIASVRSSTSLCVEAASAGTRRAARISEAIRKAGIQESREAGL